MTTQIFIGLSSFAGAIIGVEAERADWGWHILQAYKCGPEPRVSVQLGQHLSEVQARLNSQEVVDAQNAETSKKEVADFTARTGDKWTGYYHSSNKAIQTFMGDRLATVTWTGRIFTVTTPSGGRSERFNFRAKGVDGRTWAGTAYPSSGDYVRMRVVGKPSHADVCQFNGCETGELCGTSAKA